MKIPGRVRPGFSTRLRPALFSKKIAPSSMEFRDLRGRLLPPDEASLAPRGARLPSTPR
jgi:hypothetical protein